MKYGNPFSSWKRPEQIQAARDFSAKKQEEERAARIQKMKDAQEFESRVQSVNQVRSQLPSILKQSVEADRASRQLMVEAGRERTGGILATALDFNSRREDVNKAVGRISSLMPFADLLGRQQAVDQGRERVQDLSGQFSADPMTALASRNRPLQNPLDVRRDDLIRTNMGLLTAAGVPEKQATALAGYPTAEIQQALGPGGNIADIGTRQQFGAPVGSYEDSNASPSYGPDGAPLPVVGGIPGFRTLPEAASTVATLGVGTSGTPLRRGLQAIGGVVLGSGGALGGREIAEEVGAPPIVGEAIGGLGGGLAGFKVGNRLAQGVEDAGGVGTLGRRLATEEIGGTQIPGSGDGVPSGGIRGAVDELEEVPYAASRRGITSLYHETDPDRAVLIATGSMDKNGMFVAENSDLALGQGGKGAVVEFDNTNRIGVQPHRNAGGMAYEAVNERPAAYTILTSPSDGERVVRSITFKETGASRPNMMRLRNLGWVREQLPDGQIRFTNPQRVGPGTFAPPIDNAYDAANNATRNLDDIVSPSGEIRGGIRGAADDLPPIADDVVEPKVPAATRLTEWMQNEGGEAFKESARVRAERLQVARGRAAGRMGDAYSDPSLTPQQQFERATSEMGARAGDSPLPKPPMDELDAGELLAQIRDYPLFQQRRFDARNAQSGLLRLLNGDQPEMNQWGLLEKVFGAEFVKAGMAQNPSRWRTVADMLNLPRTVRTIMDVSWPLRQGIGVIRHGKELAGNWPKSIRAMFSENFHSQWDEAVRLKPQKVPVRVMWNPAKPGGAPRPRVQQWSIGELQDESGLFLPKMDEIVQGVAERTEEFAATQGDSWVSRFFGPVARPFQRNFIGYGNAVRSDIFENTLSSWTKGFTEPVNMRDAEALAWLLNVATGRGDLGKLNPHAAFLAQPLFSPRLAAARIEHTVSPALLKTGAFGVPQSDRAAALAAQQLVTLVGAGASVLAVAAAAGVGAVELSPLSARFGKLEIFKDPKNPLGETMKVDFFGGYQQYARTIAQLFAAKRKNDLGEITPVDRSEIFEQFLMNKLSPNAGIAYQLYTGDDSSNPGEKIDLKSLEGVRTFAWDNLSPISFHDVVEAVQADGVVKPVVGGLVTGVLGSSGAGTTTYGARESTVLNSIPKWDTQGILSAEQLYDLEDFYREVTATMKEWRAEYGPPGDNFTYTDALKYIGEQKGMDPNLLEWAVIFRPGSKAREEHLNPEWLQFVIDNEDALRVQRPNLFDDNYIIDALREARE